MPMVLPVVAAAFIAAGTIATAVGLTAVAVTIAGVAITWAAAATIIGVVLLAASVLMMKTPKVASAANQLDLKLDPQAPVPIAFGRTATGGYMVHRESGGSKNKYLWLTTVLSAGGPIGGIERVYGSDYLLQFSGNPQAQVATVSSVLPYTKKLYQSGKLQFRHLLGNTPEMAVSAAMPGIPSGLGAMSGLATSTLRAEYDTDNFPSGLPKLLWVVQGVKLYDPRKDSTYPGGNGAHRLDAASTWEYSENPYLAALHWTLGKWENGKKVYGIGAKWQEVDVAAFVQGANVADANGWKVGGVVTTADDKFAVLTTILQSGGGVPIARGAQISVLVNAPLTTVATITHEDVIGDLEILNTNAWRDRHNTVVPSYREETQFWNMIEGERVSAPIYVEEDANQAKSFEIEYSMVQQAAQAHQLATYELVNSREFLTFTVAVKPRLLNVRVGEAVVVTIPEVGANQKCLVVNREFNPADLTVSLTLKSETDAKHAFALGQSQEAPPSPSLNGYDPTNPPPPGETAWAITGTAISANGHTIPILLIDGENDDPYTSVIIVEYRPLGQTNWFAAGEYPKSTQHIEIASVTSGTAYEVAISYRTVKNAVSDRLILGPVTAGELVIDWENIGGKPTLITNTGPWQVGYAYKVNDLFQFGNDTYIVIADHTASADNPPPNEFVAVFAGGGSASITGYLTNEAHLIASNANGDVSSGDLAAAGGRFMVQHGLDDVTGQATFSVFSATAGLSISIDAQGNYVVSALTADTGKAILRAEYQGFVTERTFTIAKVKDGRLIQLSVDHQTFTFDGAGLPSPISQIATFTARKTGTTSATVWTVKDAGGVNKTPVSSYLTVSGDTATMDLAQFGLARGSSNGVIITASVTDATTISDSVSLIRVKDGKDGTSPLTAYLTNEAHTIAANDDGTLVGNLAEAGGQMRVFNGSADITSQCQFQVESEVGVDVSIGTNGAYVVLGMSADSGKAVFSAQYQDFEITKEFSISKAKGGKNARLLFITSDRQTISYLGDGSLDDDPQLITFRAYKQNTTATVNWSATTMAGGPVSASALSGTSGDSVTMTGEQFEAARQGTKGVIVKGTITDGGQTISDTMSVIMVMDGVRGQDGTDGKDGQPGAPGAPAPHAKFQFSVDGSTNWHDTVVPGVDVFMRVSSDGGATWGPAMRFAGEDGEDGDAGVNAKWLMLTTDRQGVTYQNGALTPNPVSQDIHFTVQRQNTNTALTWTVRTMAGVSVANPMAIVGGAATMTAAQFDTARGGTEGVIVEVSTTDGGQTLSDSISIYRITSGTTSFVLQTDTQSTTNVGVNSAIRFSGTGWDTATAYTKEAFTGSLRIGFSIPVVSSQWTIGFHRPDLANITYQNISYRMEGIGDGAVACIVRNAEKARFNNLLATDRLEVVLQDGVAKFLRNGTVVYTERMIEAPALTWRMRLSLNSNGAIIRDIAFGSLQTPGLIGYLSNEAHTVAADSAGVVSNYNGAGGTFRVYQGSQELTATGMITFATISTSNVTASIAATGVYTISNLTADSGTVTFRASISGAGSAYAEVTRIYTISKSKAGKNGNRSQYVFIRSATQPTKPSGNGIPAGWFDGPPVSDGNPVWTSVATQDSTGVTLNSTGVADPAAWSVPVKMEGVDGADGSDGSSGSFIDLKFRRDLIYPDTPPKVKNTAGFGGPQPIGWSDSPPGGANTLYVIRSTKAFSGEMITGWSSPVAINPQTSRGGWAVGQVYKVYDVVIYNGGQYMATVNHTAVNENRPSGTANANSFWDVLSAPGGTGNNATPPPSLNTVITIPGGEGMVNLRSLADALGYTGQQNADLLFRVNPASQNVRYGMRGEEGQPGGIAIDTGVWPTEWTTKLTLDINGVVYGGGGGGGKGGSYGAGQDGGVGGDCIFMRHDLYLTGTHNGIGKIYGGCGGGGGGGSGFVRKDQPMRDLTGYWSPTTGSPKQPNEAGYMDNQDPRRIFIAEDNYYLGGGGGGGGAPNGRGGSAGDGVKPGGASAKGQAGTEGATAYNSGAIPMRGIGGGAYARDPAFDNIPDNQPEPPAFYLRGVNMWEFVREVIGSDGTKRWQSYTPDDGQGVGGKGGHGRDPIHGNITSQPGYEAAYSGGQNGGDGYAVRRNGFKLFLDVGLSSQAEYVEVANAEGDSQSQVVIGAGLPRINIFGRIG